MTIEMRRLPVLTEKALADTKALQVQTGDQYEQSLHKEGGTLSCYKGCSWCCHHPFLITVAEGILLHRYLKQAGLWNSDLRKRLEDHRAKTKNLSPEVWLLSVIPCPLLDNRECVAYGSRPLHCRATFSTGDPLGCHPHELGESTALLASSSTVIMDYLEKVRAILKKVDFPNRMYTISEAILMGSKVVSGELELADLEAKFWEELANG